MVALAARQHGVVSRAQLVALGFSKAAIDARVKAGRLYPLYRGVYLVGHPLVPPFAREMGAVLACGDGAVVSHLSAAHLWALLPYPARHRRIDVTVPGRDSRGGEGIRAHRVKRLHPRDTRTCRRIPVTTPARTILDLAGSELPRVFEQALAEAERRKLVTRRHLEAVLERNGRRAGAPLLRAALASDAAPPWTRSEAEERFLALVRSAGLPPPEVNVRLGPYEVDFLWRAERLIVEVDSFGFHSSRAAFESDRLRDAELQANGLRVVRVTWRQLAGEPEEMLGRLARALDAACRTSGERGPGVRPDR
jgi:very-short-patch-repair endonuclease